MTVRKNSGTCIRHISWRRKSGTACVSSKTPTLLFTINKLFTERYKLTLCLLYKLNTSSGYSPTSPLGDRGLILGQHIWNLWWTKCHRGHDFPQVFGFLPFNIILPLLRTHLFINTILIRRTSGQSVGTAFFFFCISGALDWNLKWPWYLILHNVSGRNNAVGIRCDLPGHVLWLRTSCAI